MSSYIISILTLPDAAAGKEASVLKYIYINAMIYIPTRFELGPGPQIDEEVKKTVVILKKYATTKCERRSKNRRGHGGFGKMTSRKNRKRETFPAGCGLLSQKPDVSNEWRSVPTNSLSGLVVKRASRPLAEAAYRISK